MDLDIEQFLETKRQVRLGGIRSVAEENGAEFTTLLDPEMMNYVLEWDLNRAPFTTNRRQLAEIGIEAPTSLDSMESTEIEQSFQSVVSGLARLNIFCVQKKDSSIQESFEILLKALEERVRDLPPSEGVTEYLEIG